MRRVIYSPGKHFLVIEGHRIFESEEVMSLSDYAVVLTGTPYTLRKRKVPTPETSLQLYCDRVRPHVRELNSSKKILNVDARTPADSMVKKIAAFIIMHDLGLPEAGRYLSDTKTILETSETSWYWALWTPGILMTLSLFGRHAFSVFSLRHYDTTKLHTMPRDDITDSQASMSEPSCIIMPLAGTTWLSSPDVKMNGFLLKCSTWLDMPNVALAFKFFLCVKCQELVQDTDDTFQPRVLRLNSTILLVFLPNHELSRSAWHWRRSSNRWRTCKRSQWYIIGTYSFTFTKSMGFGPPTAEELQEYQKIQPLWNPIVPPSLICSDAFDLVLHQEIRLKMQLHPRHLLHQDHLFFFRALLVYNPMWKEHLWHWKLLLSAHCKLHPLTWSGLISDWSLHITFQGHLLVRGLLSSQPMYKPRKDPYRNLHKGINKMFLLCLGFLGALSCSFFLLCVDRIFLTLFVRLKVVQEFQGFPSIPFRWKMNFKNFFNNIKPLTK